MKKMKIKPTHHYQLVFPLLFSFFFYFLVIKAQQNMTSSTTTTTGITVDEFKVGVVLDMDSLVAKMGLTSMFMALSDFYSSTNNNTSHKTRLVLYTRNSNGDNVDAASAAIDLIKNVEVQAIIGPITSSQARFMVDLGNKTQVPMISFSATSPFVSPTKNPYFIRTAHNDTSQMKAIVAIVKAFRWKEVVPVYEDTEYGNGVIPYLTDAFQEIDTQVPYKSLIHPSASDDEILIELNKLKTMRNRVFVVHMTPSLGSRVFRKAKKIGMMSEGYSWIITDGLANFLYSLDSSVIDSMQGVLGVRPYIPRSKELDTFRVRWKTKFLQENPYIESDEDLNVFGLWAYDTIWALATAVEKLKTMNNSRFLKAKVALNQTDIAALGVSHIGPKLLQEISNIKLKGLSGEFRLADRQLQSDIFQILNVHAEGGREIGLWTPSSGFLRDIIDSTTRTNNNASLTSSKDNLRPIIWPGDTVVMPKGLAVQTNEIQLRIGVPIKVGFNEFVNVRRNNNTNSTEFTGYCIDVFNAVMKRLPYVVTYKFFPFETQNGTSAGSYDDLIYQVYTKNYDAVVGDITIVANRSLYVDFTLPFTESGVSMIVPVKEDVRKKAWIFLKPLTMELWLTSGAFFILIGVVIWILEHRINNEFRGPVSHQLGTMFWFSFSTLVFAHREKVVSNLGRFVVIIWIFLVLILTSSYTASLTSMLTVHRLEPTITDINQLINNGDKVGYHEGSFVLGMLKHMGFDESNLKAFNNSEDFDLAFLPVSENNVNGGIVAAFDEIPYIKLLLARYCAKYTTVGPSYKTDGFGFVRDHEVVLVMGQNTSSTVDEFKVGVVLDLDRLTTKMGLTSISMALSDFYSSTNTSHKRRLVLHIRDSNRDNVDAASLSLSLSHHLIIFQLFSWWIGNKAHVPIISFTATSPSISPSQNPYFIRMTQKDSSQVHAIVVIVKAFGWREVVPIYEDTEYGNGVIPYLTDALQEINTRVPYRSVIPLEATDDRILEELYKMMTMQTRVFIVHMSYSLGLHFFQKAKMIGMMSEGYSWIITDGIGDFLHSFNSSSFDSMQGVLGIRPYIPKSNELNTFRVRWKKKFLQENQDIEKADLNIFGIWAYDAIWALASAVENLKRMNSTFLKPKVVLNSSAIAPLGVSQIGSDLLQEISKVKFKGLSGEFRVIDRQLQLDAFQIVNVVGNGEREIGIWTAKSGILRDPDLIGTTNVYKTSKGNLRPIIWPGDSVVVPKGWVIPTNEKKLRIGVPMKEGFTEFVKITRNTSTNSMYVTGYCIDVFNAAIEMLPYVVPYEFIPFQKTDGTSAGSYNDLTYQVYTQNYDAVVGDVTIIANRSLYVDFTLPYTEYGEKVASNLGRFVVIVWVSVVLILTSSYTASLTSMLTVHQLVPTITDINELIKNGDNVGYQKGSFVFEMLKQMGFDESNLKNEETEDSRQEEEFRAEEQDCISSITPCFCWRVANFKRQRRFNRTRKVAQKNFLRSILKYMNKPEVSKRISTVMELNNNGEKGKIKPNQGRKM
ncbi:Ionotropic glutamate receptor [Macleaya cordata]|uniref:Ionotropic glutamate receptor n=1 Tax=Macleaya cordata TaxID=56857 RepID=A0A200QTG5_MACCD|nr:Ionotropic glutamate receptor [Macleaya cordata]